MLVYGKCKHGWKLTKSLNPNGVHWNLFSGVGGSVSRCWSFWRTELLCLSNLSAFWVVHNTNSDGLLSFHPFPGRRRWVELVRSGSGCVCFSVCVCIVWWCSGWYWDDWATADSDLVEPYLYMLSVSKWSLGAGDKMDMCVVCVCVHIIQKWDFFVTVF